MRNMKATISVDHDANNVVHGLHKIKVFPGIDLTEDPVIFSGPGTADFSSYLRRITPQQVAMRAGYVSEIQQTLSSMAQRCRGGLLYGSQEDCDMVTQPPIFHETHGCWTCQDSNQYALPGQPLLVRSGQPLLIRTSAG